MKNIYLGLLFVLVSTSGYTQFGGGSLKKADYYFENFAYSKAIEKYIESQDETISSYRNLAISYGKIGNTSKSEEVFAKVVAYDTKTAEDVFAYASMLQQNKKYEEFGKWMEIFNTMTNVKDSRGVSYKNNNRYYVQLLKDKEQFSIKNLAINSEQQDFGAAFYQNKIIFASSREGIKVVRRKWNWNSLPFLDIYQSDIIENNEVNAVSLFSKKFILKYHEGPVAFNVTQTKMITTVNNYAGKGEDGVVKLKLLIREYADEKWQKAEEFLLNSEEYSIGHASINAQETWMYFASDMPGGIGGVDIYKVAINEEGSYGEPINLGSKINSEGDEMFPFIHSDGMLFFSSNGKLGLGGLDIFVAQVKKDDSIGKVNNLGTPINTNKDDFAFILDPEMKIGYFSSNREGGHGDDDIYSFNLLKPITFNKELRGIAKDKTGNLLEGVLVNLIDENSGDTLVATTSSDGSYTFEVEEDRKFKLQGSKLKYFDGKNAVDTHTDEPIIYANLILEKDPGLSLYVLITDSKTMAPLDSVKILILDNMTGNMIDYLTPSTGDYKQGLADKKINDRGSYNLSLSKRGYLAKTVTYNIKFDHEGQYNIHESLDLSMVKIEIGEDLAKIININPIYFDLGKSKIRKDAALELDKMVKVMNENPEMIVELGAHTDSRGTAKSNELLSGKRAKASAAYVKSRITKPERISGKGYGEVNLVNECADGVKCSSEKHQENRRTEFKIIKF